MGDNLKMTKYWLINLGQNICMYPIIFLFYQNKQQNKNYLRAGEHRFFCKPSTVSFIKSSWEGWWKEEENKD